MLFDFIRKDMLFFTFFLAIFCTVTPHDLRKDYSGHQVWRVNTTSESQQKLLLDHLKDKDVWRWENNSIDFVLDGNQTLAWEELLKTQNITHKILYFDLQKKIDEENFHFNVSRRAGSPTPTYKSLKEIDQYLKKLVSKNPSVCTLSSLGTTANKKDIKLLKVSNGNTGSKVLVDSGVHAREWSTIAAVLYTIEKIAENFNEQPDYIKDNQCNKKQAEEQSERDDLSGHVPLSPIWDASINVDFRLITCVSQLEVARRYFIPVLNPDGYEYSLTKDRMWRKNRHRFSGPCDGVDLNRNFDHDWGNHDASGAMCNQLFCGTHPFSEAESQALKALQERERFFAYVSVHSYGNRIIYPWTYNGAPSEDQDRHINVVRQMHKAMLKISGVHYKAGTVRTLGLKLSSGTSTDWMYNQGVVHSYVIETRGQNHFLNPFDLKFACEEIYTGLVEMAKLL